jgi:hypothetical protein
MTAIMIEMFVLGFLCGVLLVAGILGVILHGK